MCVCVWGARKWVGVSVRMRARMYASLCVVRMFAVCVAAARLRYIHVTSEVHVVASYVTSEVHVVASYVTSEVHAVASWWYVTSEVHVVY